MAAGLPPGTNSSFAFGYAAHLAARLFGCDAAFLSHGYLDPQLGAQRLNAIASLCEVRQIDTGLATNLDPEMLCGSPIAIAGFQHDSLDDMTEARAMPFQAPL
ncbi:MAG TPA: hypothetical protein VJ770_04495 [Stellaceae bacterium]|nr:hypothetical protein [Stellaceae bacterium]